jgi:hypothetical protein
MAAVSVSVEAKGPARHHRGGVARQELGVEAGVVDGQHLEPAERRARLRAPGPGERHRVGRGGQRQADIVERRRRVRPGGALLVAHFLPRQHRLLLRRRGPTQLALALVGDEHGEQRL